MISSNVYKELEEASALEKKTTLGKYNVDIDSRGEAPLKELRQRTVISSNVYKDSVGLQCLGKSMVTTLGNYDVDIDSRGEASLKELRQRTVISSNV